jgi:hypothetical protein
LLVTALVAALLAAGPKTAQPPTPREAFDRSRTAFGRAEYGRAIDMLHPLLYPEVLLDSEGEVVQAHRMLGVSYLFENRPDEARREFRKLLELRPDYRFDPLLDPQRVVDFFNGVVKEEEAAIATMEARRRQREQELLLRRQREQRLHTAAPIVMVYERRSFAINFIPFGAGQFQNGDRRKGWMFLGVESALAAISVGAFAANFALYGVAPQLPCMNTNLGGECPAALIDHSGEERSQTLLRVQLVSGGLFFAVAAWGIVDAIRHFQPDTLLARQAAPAPRDSSFRLTLTPNGLGAAWGF